MLNRQPLCLDLCGGLGGWAEGFIEAGYQVVGYDIKDWGYPGYLVIQDVREVEAIASYWQGQVDVMLASPPCQEFSIRDMPWGRTKEMPPPDMSIVEAVLELAKLIKPKVFVMENVWGAQPYIGRAPIHRKSLYFWGDVAMMPECPKEFSKSGRLAYNHDNRWNVDPMERAKIPFQLSYGFALACKGGL